MEKWTDSSAGGSGEVTQHRVSPSGSKSVGAPVHPNGNYDATDSRRDKGAASGFASVDDNAGSVTDKDFDHVTSRFPDGDGWKQT